jgi:hypothetical protein
LLSLTVNAPLWKAIAEVDSKYRCGRMERRSPIRVARSVWPVAHSIIISFFVLTERKGSEIVADSGGGECHYDVHWILAGAGLS